MRLTRLFCLIALVVAVMALPAAADDIVYVDPATLQINGSGGDPNQFTNNSVFVFQNQGGATNLNNPWLLILGVPNTSVANPFGAGISSVTSSAGGATSWSYVGFQTSMTGSPNGQDAYSKLGYSGLTASNSFVNWAGADLTINGITATSFGLYEYSINAALGAKDTVTVNFSSMPIGTFVIAYGETSETTTKCTGPPSNRVCTTTTTITQYDTPFTNAGLRTRTPEPASMLLLGAGMLGLLGIRRIRK